MCVRRTAPRITHPVILWLPNSGRVCECGHGPRRFPEFGGGVAAPPPDSVSVFATGVASPSMRSPALARSMPSLCQVRQPSSPGNFPDTSSSRNAAVHARSASSMASPYSVSTMNNRGREPAAASNSARTVVICSSRASTRRPSRSITSSGGSAARIDSPATYCRCSGCGSAMSSWSSRSVRRGRRR